LAAELGILCPSSSRSLGDQDPRIFNWTIILRRALSDTDWDIVVRTDMTLARLKLRSDFRSTKSRFEAASD
jgi:hypothetical protein